MDWMSIVTSDGIEDPTELWYTYCPVPSASVIAVSKGWLKTRFARSGTQVRSIGEASLGERARHFTYEGPGLFREGGNIPPLVSLSRGSRLLVIGMTGIDEPQLIVARRDDTERHDFASLKGARVAVPCRPDESVDFHRALTAKLFADALESVGLTTNDVEWVNIAVDEPYLDQPDIADGDSIWSSRFRYTFEAPVFRALLRDEVDAVVTRPPLSALFTEMFAARSLGNVAVLGASTNLNPTIVTVSAEFAEAWPNAVVLYLEALGYAAEWAERNVREAMDTLARALNVPVSAMTSYGTASHLCSHLLPSMEPDLIERLEEQKSWLDANGYLENPYELSEAIDPTFLAAVRRSEVEHVG